MVETVIAGCHGCAKLIRAIKKCENASEMGAAGRSAWFARARMSPAMETVIARASPEAIYGGTAHACRHSRVRGNPSPAGTPVPTIWQRRASLPAISWTPDRSPG
jgi:hypothetical protein